MKTQTSVQESHKWEDNHSCKGSPQGGRSCGEGEPLCTVGVNVNWCSHYEIVQRVLNNLKITVPYGPVHHSWILPEERENTNLKDMCTLMYAAALFTTAKICEGHKCPCVCANSVTQSCPALCDPMDCSLTDSSVHGILQARVLEWAAIPFSKGSSQHRG